MSYINTTTHYKWPLPEETDLFNGLDDNQMKEDLDEKIYNLEQRSTGDHEAVTQLNTRVTEVEKTVGGYDEEIEALQGTVGEHAERLVNLTNRQTELSRRLNGKAGEATIAPEYNEEETYSVGDFVYHNNILYKAKNASATPAGTFDAGDWDIAILTDELGGSTPGTIAAINVTYDDVLTQLGANDAQGAIVALKTLIDKIGGGGMRVVKAGTITVGGTAVNIDLSDLGFTSELDYSVRLNTGVTRSNDQAFAFGMGAYVSDRTATSVSLMGNSSTGSINVSYEILA